MRPVFGMATLLVLSGCWDFDKAKSDFCSKPGAFCGSAQQDGGDDAGTVSDSGVDAGADGGGTLPADWVKNAVELGGTNSEQVTGLETLTVNTVTQVAMSGWYEVSTTVGGQKVTSPQRGGFVALASPQFTDVKMVSVRTDMSDIEVDAMAPWSSYASVLIAGDVGNDSSVIVEGQTVSQTLPPRIGSRNGYVAKVNSNGTPAWVSRVGAGTNELSQLDVSAVTAEDKAGGRIWVGGTFRDELRFDTSQYKTNTMAGFLAEFGPDGAYSNVTQGSCGSLSIDGTTRVNAATTTLGYGFAGGDFTSNCSFGQHPLSAAYQSGFVARVSSGGATTAMLTFISKDGFASVEHLDAAEGVIYGAVRFGGNMEVKRSVTETVAAGGFGDALFFSASHSLDQVLQMYVISTGSGGEVHRPRIRRTGQGVFLIWGGFTGTLNFGSGVTLTNPLTSPSGFIARVEQKGSEWAAKWAKVIPSDANASNFPDTSVRGVAMLPTSFVAAGSFLGKLTLGNYFFETKPAQVGDADKDQIYFFEF